MNAEAQETQSIAMEFDLPHAPAKVWRALTEPALLAKWLMSTNMETVVGKAFTFQAPASPQWDGIVNCEMKEIERERRIRYSWGGNGLDTIVTWTLTPTKSGGTLLQLEHSGFGTGKSQAWFYSGAKKGWEFMIGQRLPEALK